MVDNDDSLALPEIEEHETKKYKKHINDLIEDAELEAEMREEAESLEFERAAELRDRIAELREKIAG